MKNHTITPEDLQRVKNITVEKTLFASVTGSGSKSLSILSEIDYYNHIESWYIVSLNDTVICKTKELEKAIKAYNGAVIPRGGQRKQ